MLNPVFSFLMEIKNKGVIFKNHKIVICKLSKSNTKLEIQGVYAGRKIEISLHQEDKIKLSVSLDDKKRFFKCVSDFKKASEFVNAEVFF